MRENKILRYILQSAMMLAFALVFSFCISLPANAQNLDEIKNYVITADVNEDATVKLNYHIEWLVLDSDSEGPLEWVKIGIPNSHVNEYEANSDTISEMDIDYDDGTYMRIDFDRPYYEGEVAVFDFTIEQDYLYQINLNEEGYTVYTFTPGWFDEIEIDHLTIRWNADKMSGWNPESLVKDGYNEWTTSLSEGETYTVYITYPNDAFAFNQDVSDGYSDGDDDYFYTDGGSDASDFAFVFIFFIMAVVFLAAPIVVVVVAITAAGKYASGASLGNKTETKITRTKVIYHTNCPNCGGPRAEGKDSCEYCGTNLVKSEEILKEETMTKEEKRRYSRDGEFSYNSIPDTYIRVHTVHVPVSRPVHRSSGGGRSSGGCAHSSCACACASCACACACAGGGRAGCSTKDFYNKSLKLKQLEYKTKKH